LIRQPSRKLDAKIHHPARGSGVTRIRRDSRTARIDLVTGPGSGKIGLTIRHARRLGRHVHIAIGLSGHSRGWITHPLCGQISGSENDKSGRQTARKKRTQHGFSVQQCIHSLRNAGCGLEGASKSQRSGRLLGGCVTFRSAHVAVTRRRSSGRRRPRRARIYRRSREAR